MSAHQPDAVEANIETHPVKLALAVVAGAVGLIIAIVMLAYFATGTHTIGAGDSRMHSPEAVAARIAPQTTLAIDAGKTPAAASSPAAPQAVPTPAPAAIVPAAETKVVSGDGIYKMACATCHLAGIAGAPKSGDKAAWGPRLAQGKETLYKHALAGFQGKSGVMPPKGGFSQLSDADVKAAVDYMLSLVK